MSFRKLFGYFLQKGFQKGNIVSLEINCIGQMKENGDLNEDYSSVVEKR